MKENAARDNFSGKTGFVLACIGSAVGVGNIWLFPRRVAAFGAPFLVAYLICVIAVGLPGVIGEMAFGRAMSAGPSGAFEAASEKAGKGRTLGGALSLIPVMGSFAMGIGYSVVCGWILKYTVGSFTGSVLAPEGVADFGGLFGATASGAGNIVCHLIILAVTFIIVAFGISGGIEKANRFFMPLFFLMFIGIAVYVSTLDGAARGYAYMFKASDWSLLGSGSVWKYAMGQAFFSLCLAGNGTLVYGSYLKKNEDNIPACASMVALFDTLAAFVAALAIIPIIYAAGIDMATEVTSGPGLMFIYLPFIFRNMAIGQPVAIVFFTAVLFAALSSIINLFEAPIEAVQGRLGLDRIPAAAAVIAVGSIIAILIVDITSDWMDVCSIYICPIGALLAAVMFFWVCGEEFAAGEIESGGKPGCGRLYAKLGKYVFCSLSILVLVVGSLTPGGIG